MALVKESAAVAATEIPAVRDGAGRDSAPRTRRRNLGGARLKLEVIGDLPGYHLYWANDHEGAIENLLYDGFDFVKPDEVGMVSHIVEDTDLSNRISRFVGPKPDGTPMRAYLLKCSNEIWADYEDAREEQAATWEADILHRQETPGANLYKPKGVNTVLDTAYRK